MVCDRKGLPPPQHPRKSCSGSISKRKVSSPTIKKTKISVRSRKTVTQDSNPIVIEDDNNQYKETDTPKYPDVLSYSFS